MDGRILLFGLIVYMVFALRQSRVRKQGSTKGVCRENLRKKNRTQQRRPFINIVFILIGLGLLVLGSNWLVDSAVQIAESSWRE